MTDVNIKYGKSAKDTATLLLAAAESLDMPASVVRTQEGGFIAPREVAEEAGVDIEQGDDDAQTSGESDAPVKKTATKKAAAKKTAKKGS